MLITGATGFLGSHLTTKLLEKGERDLRCFVRPGRNTRLLYSLKRKFRYAEVDTFEGNLTNPADAKKAVDGVGTIYHCAADKKGPIASMYLNTVVATRNLLEAVIRKNRLRRFVHVSSFAVYGTGNLDRGTVVNEETPLESDLKKRDDAYTYIKLRQEELVWKYRELHDLPVVILRPGVVYGPGGDEISRRVGISLFGHFLNIGGDNVLPLSYIDNCADALILAGTVPEIEGEVFNVHDSELRTCNEFLSLYFKRVRKIKSMKVPYHLFWLFSWIINKYARYSKGQIPPVLSPYKTASTWKGNRFDNRKLIEMLNWSQSVSTTEGLERHFEYCRRLHSENSG